MLTAAFLFAALLPNAMDYPSPDQAGFHHCALIYRNQCRNVDDMMTYAAQMKDGKPQRWLFDSFLFLVYTTSRGIRTEVDATQKVDWDDQLDYWFKKGRDLDSLDKALDEVAKTLGPVPKKRQIMLSIPYLHSSVKDFGDVNGDGATEDLSKESGRRAVLNWYIGEAKQRFKAAGYKHLELWGFYWMNEATGSGDAEKIKLASRLVHEAGHKLLWIPWHRAPRWEQWKLFGFDAAIMQPNYAFVSSIHKGTIKRNRLAANADMTRSYGLGVEMEMGNVMSSDADRRAFYHYLADGAKSRYGYQDAATAYYLGTSCVEQCASSSDPEVRKVYDLLCDYVCNREVPDQDPHVEWGSSARLPIGLDKPVEIEGRLAKSTLVKSVEVYVDESDADSVWQGSVQVEILNESGAWVPGGWAIKAARDLNSGVHQVIAVPVEQTALGLRLKVNPAPNRAGKLVQVSIDSTSIEPVARHLAFNKTYRVDPPSGKPTYGDEGKFLTDGYVAKTGFLEHKTVGWSNEDVSVVFDLGKPRRIDMIEAVCEYCPSASVYWPSSALAFVSDEPVDSLSPAGFGSLPASLRWMSPKGPAAEQVRKDGNQDGKYVFSADGPVTGRYATVQLRANEWLMVPEVRVFSEGKNIAPECDYTLAPAPTTSSNSDNPYPDDGRKLTDGKIAQGFVGGMLVGWQNGEDRTVTVDLGAEKEMRTVTVWSLRGGLDAIFAPAWVSVEVSKDGQHWYAKKVVEKDSAPEDGKTCIAAPYRAVLSGSTKARFVRVQAARSTGWAMLSEIVVE